MIYEEQKMKIIETELANLQKWAKNARKSSPRGLVRLKEQVIALGLYKPMVGYKDGDGKVVILGGNTRLKALRELQDEGYKKIDYSKIKVCIVEPVDEEEKLKINMSDNDNVGTYDPTSFTDILQDIDFSKIDASVYQIQSENLALWLKKIEKKEKDEGIPDEPLYPITKRLHEKYNYVLIFTTNETDNTFMEQFFDFRKHKSYRFSTYLGETRVIDFQSFLNAINKKKENIYENCDSVNEQAPDDNNPKSAE